MARSVVVVTSCILSPNMPCFQNPKDRTGHQYSRIYLSANPVIACCQNFIVPSIDHPANDGFFLKTAGMIKNYSLHSR